MKRRVLNAAANKKVLRQCAAASGARAPYRVLCDASFLRVSFDYFRHYRKAGERLGHRELEATLPSIETLFSELFGTSQYFLQTTAESREDFLTTYQTSHSNTGAKKKKQQEEEEAKLLMGGGAKAAAATTDDSTAAADASAKKEEPKKKAAPAAPAAPVNAKMEADAHTFLRKFEVIGEGAGAAIGFGATPQSATGERRNEHKAVVAALSQIASGKSSSGFVHPLSSYVVATVNHDVKAMLRRGDVVGAVAPIPTVRMTFNPWLLWIEAGELTRAGAQQAVDAAQQQKQSAATSEPIFSSNVSNKADRAFLGHLVKESTKLASTVAARNKFLASGFNKKVNPHHAGRPPHRGGQNNNSNNKAQPKGPQPNANPLAMKKKRQRETIVCDDGEDKKKSRAEK